MIDSQVNIVLDAIGKRFRNRVLFEDVNLNIVSGERVAITGSNGSGKSTLLKIIGGLLRPTAGAVSIHVDGTIVDPEQHSLAFGYVAPASNVYSGLSGRENIEFIQSFYSRSNATADEILERVGLGDAGDRAVGEYSSGMIQRVKLACAMVGNPDALLLDEPFSNLDSQGVDVVEGIIEEFVASGKPVMIATNVGDEAARCDRRVDIEDYKRVPVSKGG
ncbi:MAG: ABC transporter ATP-binding protein [Rhodothermales bacterium]|nr:ABC transporter ATP-binding protein [Rhodothermales bacterium]